MRYSIRRRPWPSAPQLLHPLCHRHNGVRGFIPARGGCPTRFGARQYECAVVCAREAVRLHFKTRLQLLCEVEDGVTCKATKTLSTLRR